jgi:hypothetical protein
MQSRLADPRLQLLGEITVAALAEHESQRLLARKREADRLRQEMEDRIARVRAAAETRADVAGSLRIYRKGRQPAKAPAESFCTTRSENRVAVVGLKHAAEFLQFARLREGDAFTTIAETPSALYDAIGHETCSIVIDNAVNLWTYMQAIGRDGQFAYNVGPTIAVEQAREPYARSLGFATWDDFEFAGAVGNANADDIRELKEAGVADAAAFRAIVARMKQMGYAVGIEPTAQVVATFLEDEAEGRKTGISALQVRKAILERIAEEDRRAEEEADRRRAEKARAFPYIAVFTCGMGDRHINILACFAAAGSSRVDTELRITTGNATKIYKAYNLRQVGQERQDGFYIELPEHFGLVAQNSHDSLILGLKIVARASGEILYQNQAARFDVVSVSN